MRSLYIFGADAPAEALVKEFRGEKELRDRLEPFIHNNQSWDVKLHAREWYYGTSGGRALFDYGFLCMNVALVSFVLAVFAKVVKVFHSWSCTVETVRLLVMIEMGCYTLIVVFTCVLIGRSSAAQGLS